MLSKRNFLAIPLFFISFQLANGQTKSNSGKEKKQRVYMDRNYSIVSNKREAVYEMVSLTQNDTTYFSTYNLLPKGLIETGKYAIDKGFDHRNCELIRYWPNGKIRSKGNLRLSWNDGIWNFYDEEGNLYSTIEYEKGLMTGTAIRYYNNGYKRSFLFKKNLRHGESVYSDAENRVIKIQTFENDTLQGAALEFYKSGSLKRKTVYKNGHKLLDSMFYENGKPFNCEKYDTDGKMHGRQTMFTEKGKLARTDEYESGILTSNGCIRPLEQEYESDDCPERFIEAQYIGGKDKLNEYIELNTDYPEDAISWKIQGVIEIEFTIMADGSIAEITQENLIPIGYGLEKETMRLLGKMKKFEPAKYYNRPEAIRYQMPFVYIIKDGN